MKKIPCLFQRDFSVKPPILLETVTPWCEWVIAGEGKATRKWDGTAVMVLGGTVYARYDAKQGKSAPEGAIPCDEPDPVTGHHPHWVIANRKQDVWIVEAFVNSAVDGHLEDGTYEAVGPRIGGNAEDLEHHVLMRHGGAEILLERTWLGIRTLLKSLYIEGIVFHHPDGRMCKIRRADYGLPWGPIR